MAFNFTSGRVEGKKFNVKKALDKATLEQTHTLTIFAVEPPNEDDYDEEEEFNDALARYEANPKFRGVVTDPEGESHNVNFARSFTSMSFGKDKKGENVDFERYCGKYKNPSLCKTPKTANIDLTGCILYVTSAKRKDNTLAIDKDGKAIRYNCYIGAPGSSDFATDPEASKVFDELDKLAEQAEASGSSNSQNSDDDF